MSTPVHAQLTGSLIATGALINLPLPSGYDAIEFTNITPAVYADNNTNHVMYSKGTGLTPAGRGIRANGAAAGISTMVWSYVNADGFTFVSDSGIQTPGAVLAATNVTAAAPALLLTAATAGIPVGSVVRLATPTGRLVLGSLDYTVTAVDPGVSLTLGNLNTTINGLGAATATNFRVIPFNPRFYPVRRTISNMTSQGVLTRITMTVTHGYTIGQLVRIYCPTTSGMSQITGLLGTIVNIGVADAASTNTIDVNIDSSGFTAFTWPTIVPCLYPFVEPVGEAATTIAGPVNPANLLDDATRNISFTGVQIGPAVLTTADTYQWIATKGVTTAIIPV